MINNRLYTNDILILVKAIDLFVAAKNTEYLTDEKHQIDLLAKSARKKFLNHEAKIYVNEIFATCICLNFWKYIILKANSNIKIGLDVKAKSEKYLSEIEYLMSQFDLQLQAFGIDIFS
ncbi:hypothetical protein [Candidatus Clostridium helianthi]|uniref:Uncharacterized protein n=1 Tax=Candidatus Clostridium helianthi TaxID=3381660 RepID=A0ABW8S131_9CLOT